MNTFKVSFKNTAGEQVVEVISVPDTINQEQFTKAANAILKDQSGLTVSPTDEATTVENELEIKSFIMVMDAEAGNVCLVNSVQPADDYDLNEHVSCIAMQLMMKGHSVEGYINDKQEIAKYYTIYADEDKTILAEDWQAPLFDLQDTVTFYSADVEKPETSAGQTVH
jgi:hypothetical protein